MMEARGWEERGGEQTPKLFCHLDRIWLCESRQLQLATKQH